MHPAHYAICCAAQCALAHLYACCEPDPCAAVQSSYLPALRQLHAGVIAVAFGPPYAYTFVRLAYGQTWAATPAPGVLAWYCLYILLLGVNGILEAFQHAVST